MPDGAIAQLGERLLCKQEVVGSIPSGSTRLADDDEYVLTDLLLGFLLRRLRRLKEAWCGGALKRSPVFVQKQKRFAPAWVRPGVRVLFDIVKRRSLRARP